jgi:5-methylcytosine-specific restriction endonuclease McrA
MPMRRNYQDKDYANFRKAVLKRDKKRCRMPGCKCRTKLQVHHIQSWADSSSLRYEPSNGITLCENCHKIVTGRERNYVKLFLEIINAT